MFASKKKSRSEGNEKQRHLRKLGHAETYQLAMYTLDQYRGTSVSCRYTIPIRFTAPEVHTTLVRVVETAIIEAILKHPILLVGIANPNSKKPAWVQLESLDLKNHIEWRILDASENFENISQETTATELDRQFPELEKIPGWRIVILRQESSDVMEILFTWNHPHSDGISGKIFHRDLLQQLSHPLPRDDKLETEPGSSIILLPSSLQLPPSLEDVCKLPLSFGYSMKMIWEEMGPSTLSWDRQHLASWSPFQLSPYKTQFRSFTIENLELEQILLSCRQHKTTLTGLLHGLTLVSIASQLSENEASAFESGTTVDLRRFIPSRPLSYPWLEPEKTMGNYVTLMAHRFDAPVVQKIRSQIPAATSRDSTFVLHKKHMDQIWCISAKVREEIEEKLASGLENDPVGTMKYVPDWRKQMADVAKRPRQFSFWITGLGMMDGLHHQRPNTMESWLPSDTAKENSWMVNRAQFALSCETTAAVFNISPMTVMGERLCVGLSWQDCLCDVSFGERLTADLKSWLVQIASA